MCLSFVGLRAQTLDPNYIDGHLYFKFVDNYDFKFAVNEDTRIDPSEMKEYANLFAEYGVTLITRPLYAFNDPVTERIVRLEFTQYKRINQFIAALEALPEVEYAERVPLPHILVTYNDPYSTGSWGSAGPYQWNLTMINAQDAWAAQVASSSIKVAVVDNAVWGAHPDLQIASSNLCNYGSGYATTGNANPPSTVNQNETCNQNYFYYGSGSCDSYDWSHGTHCAGMVAAKNNNGIGISSIGGGDGSNGSGLTLMGVRAANNSGSLYYTSNGVTWAANHGANVISMSFGGSSSSQSEASSYRNLYNNGIILVAAAGNEGDADNYKSYPACYTGVISVASVDNNRKLSSFSQWGTGKADIAAPGGYYSSTGYNNILSTTYCKNQYNRIILGTALQGQYYDGMQGTSMACPTAAGLCGLMLSAYPDMTPDQVLTCLQDNEQPLAAGSNQIDGHGYIDAEASVNCAKAMASMLRTNPSSIVIASRGGSKTIEVTSANSISANWNASCSNNAFTLSTTTGAGSGATTTITVSAPINSTGSPITGTITITQGSGSNRQQTTVSIIQNDQSDFCGFINEQFLDDDSLFYMYTVTQRLSSNNDDILFGERFVNNRVGTVDSLTFAWVWTTRTAGGQVVIKLYDDNGSNGPGNVLASKTYTIANLKSMGTSYTASNPTRNLYYLQTLGVKFDTPVQVTGNYYVGIDFSGVTETGTFRYNNQNVAEIGCSFGEVCDNAATQADYNNAILFWEGNSNVYTGSALDFTYYDLAVSAHFCESTEPWMTINPTAIAANPLMGSEEIAISANCDWTATSNCDWISVSPSSGTNADTVALSIAENMGDARDCTITFTYEGGATIELPVSQMAHQSGCNEAVLYDWQHLGWRVNDASTDYQLDEDSIYFGYNIPFDDDNTIDSGYYFGTNTELNTTASANMIEVYGTAIINSVQFIYSTTGTGGNVVFKIWDTTGAVIASKTVTMASLSGSNYYEWDLDSPLEVNSHVLVGADFSGVSSGSFFSFLTNLWYANQEHPELAIDNGYIQIGGTNWVFFYGTIGAFPSMCFNGGHLNIDLVLQQVDSDTNIITTKTLNVGDSLSASYILGNFGEAPYVDTTKIYITLDTTDLGNFFYPPMNFYAGGALVDDIDIISWEDVTALGYRHNDSFDLCLRVEQTNTTYEWEDADLTNNQSCVTVTVNCPPVVNALTETACDSYTFGTETYTESGNYSDTLTAANGCDSIVTLNLTINQSTHNVETVAECASYTWHGTEYNTSGEYTYNYTNANNCASVDTLRLTINGTPTITVDGNLTVTPGSTTTLTASGADNYNWKQNGTTVFTGNPFTTPALNSTTIYTVEGTTGDCTGSTEVTVTVQAAQATNGDTSVVACGSYTWARTGITYNASAEPTYTIVGGNHMGGDSIITLHLTINPLPIITVTGPTSVYTGQTATLEASGASTYVWATGGADMSNDNPYVTPALNATTTYTVTGTDANECTNTATHTVSVTAAPSTNGDTTVVACGSYTWARTGITYNASAEPTYTMAGGNYLGGDSIITLHLTINPLPTITVTGPTSVYTGQTATLEASGASTYVWATGGADMSNDNPYVTPALNTTTTYTVTGTDANECTNTATHTISVTSAPSTNGDTTVVACGSYTWARTGITYNASAEPTYTIVGGNYLGGDSIITLHLTINPNPTITVDGDLEIESGESTDLTASGAVSYIWTEGSTEVSTLPTFTASPVTNTTYTVTGTDANECSSTQTVTVIVSSPSTVYDTTVITACNSYEWNSNTYTTSGFYQYAEGNNVHVLDLTINQNPTITVNGNTNIYVGQTTELTAEGAVSYVWSQNGTELSSDNPFTTPTLNTTTTYTVTGTDAHNCTGTQLVTVNVTSAGSTTYEMSAEACNSYYWDLEDQTYFTSGEYRHTMPGANSNGGDSIIVLNLTINPNPTVSVSGNTNIYIGQSTTLTAEGAVSYVWSQNGTEVSTNNPYTTPELNATTTYNVTGTDANECVGTTQVTVTVVQADATTSDTTAVACTSFAWRGNTYNTSGDYSVTIAGGNHMGGDSIITLHLTINPNPSVTVSGNTNVYIGQSTTLTASGAESYTWTAGGNEVSQQNPFTTPALNTTTTYTVTGTDANGCSGTTQVTVSVGSAPATAGDTTAVACDEFTWSLNSVTYTNSGNYTAITRNVNGGDSTVTLHLTINRSTTATETQVACDSYEWHGNTYTASTNTPTFTSTNADGCDLVTTLHLTINHSSTAVEEHSACDSYTWHGTTYTASTNTPTYTTTGTNGCDLVTTLHLTINHGSSSEQSATACDSYVWTVNGQMYSTSGNYTYETTGANGCPQTTVLHLTVNYSTANTETHEACDEYIWNGTSYTQSGTYTVNETNGAGCPNVVTLNLTINPSTHEADQQVACDSYRWPTNNQTYTTSGDYTYTTVNEWGCPRIVTLNLTINNSAENNIYDTVSAGTAYSNYGFYVPGNQTGVAHPGDVIELSHTGFYTAEHCDSTVYLHLTVTENHNQGGEGIDDVNGIALKLYPNPASTTVEIEVEGISAVRVYDMSGRMLNEQTNLMGDNAKVDVTPFAEGVYVISITTQSGVTMKQKVVVKH